MLTVNDLLSALRDIAEEHGHLPVAVAVQPDYPIAGNIESARVTGPTRAAKKLYLFANVTEYGPTFVEEDDEQHIWNVL